MPKLKITEIQIDNYNETNNKFQKFAEGLNIICGQNEAGKSTMMDFIKNIFTKKSSSAKGYIKCELDGEIFNLISGDSKKIKENEQYISKLSPHEFQTGFIINLDDIMFAKKANSEELINTIKDSSGNAINKKQEEYYDYIYGGKKQEFAFTPKNGLSTNFKKQFEKLNELNIRIKELQSKEEEYNNVITSLGNIDEEITNIMERISGCEIFVDKINLESEKKEININKKLVEKKSDFDNLREEFGGLNSLKSKKEIIIQEIENNKLNLETKIKELSKLDISASENYEKINISTDDFKVGRQFIEDEKSINFEKNNIVQKISEIEKDFSQTEFEIKSIENQLKTIGIEDIETYKKDKEMLESYINRYSDFMNKVIVNDNSKYIKAKSKWYNETYLLIFGAILCASIGTLILCWHTPYKLPVIALIFISGGGLITSFMQKKDKSLDNSDSAYTNELNKTASEIINLCKKYQFELTKEENFIVRVGAYAQKMNDNCSEYKHIESDLLKERIRLERIRSDREEQINLQKEIDEKFKNIDSSKSEFIKEIGISSLDNFENIYEIIKEIKLLNQKIDEQTKELENIDKLSEEFVNKLNKFIEEANLTDYPKYNKYDDVSIVINKIGDILYENISADNKLKDIEIKIGDLNSKLTDYKELFKNSENINEAFLDDLKSQLQTKTDERGRLRQQKEDLESVSNLINLRNEKNVEFNRIKTALAKLIQKEIIYNLIKTAKEEFNQTQPNLVCAKEYFSKITNEKYSDIDFEVKTISGKEIGDKDWDNLSRGTKEQLYLALRLGYAKNYSKDITGNDNGKPDLPIIIDDAFVNFDISRTTAMIKCLSDFAKNNQVMYFTCHSQEIRDILKQNNIKHNYIEL